MSARASPRVVRVGAGNERNGPVARLPPRCGLHCGRPLLEADGASQRWHRQVVSSRTQLLVVPRPRTDIPGMRVPGVPGHVAQELHEVGLGRAAPHEGRRPSRRGRTAIGRGARGEGETERDGKDSGPRELL